MESPAWLHIIEFPFKHHHLKVKGDVIHYIDEGEGIAVVFVPGFPMWSFLFRKVIKELMGECRCVAFDPSGYGLSDKDGEVSIKAHVQQLGELIDQLNIKELLLVGEGRGTIIASHYAYAHAPKIHQLILLDGEEIRPQKGWRGSFQLWRMMNSRNRWLRRFRKRLKVKRDMAEQYFRPYWHKEDRGAIRVFFKEENTSIDHITSRVRIQKAPTQRRSDFEHKPEVLAQLIRSYVAKAHIQE